MERLENRSLLAATLVGTVWHDLNSDGQQTGGEPAVQFAVAELFSSANGTIGDADDVSLGTQITDSAGNYQFTGLAAGVNYVVAVRPPVGFAFTVPDTGSDATDSDVSAPGVSAIFTPADLSTVTLDAGLVGAAPGFGWAAGQGGTGTDEGRSVAVDAAGFSYVTGRFGGTVDFDSGPGTYSLTSAGGDDIYVAKYAPGGALVWARRSGGASNDVGNGVAVDASGNVLVTGLFQGSADFDPGIGTQDLTSAGSNDIFVWKLSSGGNYVWATRAGSTGGDIGRGVAIDSSGNVLVTGQFQGTADFDPGAGTANLTSSANSIDGFVLKLDAAGGYLWAGRVGGTSTDIGYSVAVDSGGNILATGSFSGTADFDPGAGTANLTSSASSIDGFVLKLDVAGGYLWAGRVGGTSTDIGYNLAVDSGGNVLVTGSFVGTADFDPGAGTANLTSAGNEDGFALKLDAAGGYLWAGRVGGTSTDIGYSVAVDPGGNFLVTGSFQGTADFDPGAGSANLTSVGGNDVFVLKLGTAGIYQWARQVSGTSISNDIGYSVAVDGSGNVLVTGSFQGTADFEPGAGTFNRTSAGGSDGFLWRLTANQFAPDINLVGNGQVIVSGDTTPAFGDHTDFSAALVAGGTQVRAFTIQNSGTAVVILTGNPLIQLGGSHAADFTVSVLPESSISEEQSTTLQITFDPSAAGLRTATVTIQNNDADEGSYTFAIQGTGTAPAIVEGTVWHDLNSDGQQSGGEPGCPYAVVELFDTVDGVAGNADDLSRGVQVTNASGAYQFTGLAAGVNYVVAVRPPVGFAFTVPDTGSDATDSDVSAPGVSAIFTPADLSTVAVNAGLVGAAPGFGWAAGLGGTGTDEGLSVAVDAAGYSYVTGRFGGTVDFDSGPGTYNLTSAGSSDVYVAKYAPGGALVWARQAGGTGDDIGEGVAVDAVGDVLVTGSFSGTADFDPGAGTANLTSSANSIDGFVLKLDAAGGYLWAGRVGGTSTDIGHSLAVDAVGNVMVTGYFSGTADFDPGAGTANLTSAGNEDVFVLKLDSAGAYQWARRIGSNGFDGDIGWGVAVDAAGNVIVAGSFTGTVDFDPGAGVANLTMAGWVDVFILKLDSAGTYQWARQVGGTNRDLGRGVAIDADGNVLVAGYFEGTADFDPGAGVANLITAGFLSLDAFILKLDAGGNYQWARRVGGTGDDYGTGVAIDAGGNVLVTGAFEFTADFDPGVGTASLASAGNDDGFVLKLDAAGAYQWAQRFGGSDSDYVGGVAIDGSGNVLVTGSFQGTADFDPGAGTVNFTSAGSSDGFLWRLEGNQFAPEIRLVGNGQAIVSGDATPEIADHTDFGSRTVTSGQSMQWFAVENTGTAVLKLTGTPRIVIGGSHAGDFTVSVLPDSTVNDGQSAGFQITFDPSAPGLRTATVMIQSDDTDEGSYSFAIQGMGLASFAPSTVFGTVWYDLNADGQQTGGEPAIQYAVVELFDTVDGVAGNADDLSLGVQVTNAGGNYQFTGLLHPGPYHVLVRPPVGYSFTTQDTGAEATDSDVSIVGLSGPAALASGQAVAVNAGLVGAAPGFGWAAGLGGTGTDEGLSVAVDAAGYSYVTGRFGGTVDFDSGPGTYNLTSAGSSDVYVAKYAPGGALVWARQAGGTGDDIGEGVAVDAVGDVLVTGSFSGTADFDPGAGTFNLASAGGTDIFVWKLTTAGNLAWAAKAGGSSGDIGRGVAIDSSGNVLVTGQFQGTADFDPGAGTANLTSAGNEDAFVLKLDAAGNYQWAGRVGGISFDRGYGVAVDGSGNVLVTGRFLGTADFDPGAGTANLTSGSSGATFVLKFDAAGNYVWAGRVGGSVNSFINEGGVAVDASGNVMVTGSFEGTADFDPGAGTANLMSAGGNDAFVLKLDAAGDYQWAGRVGGSSTDVGYGVAVDASGNVLVTGSFQGIADFNPGSGIINLTSAGSVDAFVFKLDAAGIYQWARPVGGTSYDVGLGVAVDTSGNVLVTGLFQGTADFDPGAGTANLNSAGSSDGYVWQLSAANFLPPTVTDVFIRGTGDGSGSGNDEWLAAYLTHLGTQGLGDAALGYRVSVGADQLDTLPWTNIDTVSIRFSEAVIVLSGNMQVLGAAEGPAVPAVASFSYNTSTFTATWQFAAPLPANKYLLHFTSGVVVDLDTMALDGEWSDGVSTVSGNGSAGGAFSFRINVVPGDVNGDTVTTQSVTNADVLLTKQALSTDMSLGAGYLYRRDVNGSGAITNADVLQAKQRLSTSIFDYTAPSPPPAPGGESFDGEDALSGTDGAFAALGSASSDGESLSSGTTTGSGPLDPAAWDAAILATYGQTKKDDQP